MLPYTIKQKRFNCLNLSVFTNVVSYSVYINSLNLSLFTNVVSYSVYVITYYQNKSYS
jgi:hypothetical protein